jgi:hypothetical protein
MSNAPAPVFFAPFADEPHEAWNELRNIGESWLGRPLRDRKVFALSFVHDGVDYYARVGEPRHAPSTTRCAGRLTTIGRHVAMTMALQCSQFSRPRKTAGRS